VAALSVLILSDLPMADVFVDTDFELNLLFEGQKEPAAAFLQLSEAFQFLYYFDKWVLSALGESDAIEYSITNLEYSSIRSFIAQILRAVPDKAIEELDWKKMVGALLLKAKYRFLKYLEKNKEIGRRSDVDTITEGINKDIKESGLTALIIVTPINPFPLVNIYEEAIKTVNKLNHGEQVEYKSAYGNARITSGIGFDKLKMISELGEQILTNETTEVLKVKKLDMLSNEARWDFKKDHHALNGVKISDQQWLNDFHARKFSLLPDDSLRVQLKTTYVQSPDPHFSRTSWEILKVMEIISPTESNNLLF
jgi:hypothetical protein